MRRRDIRAQRDERDRERWGQLGDALDFADTEFTDDMPELAAFDWPMPEAKQQEQQQ